MSGDERPGAAAWVPDDAPVERLREEAQECRGCELWRAATQAVFGDGPSPARLMLVGEQPGDREDRAGEPFVGPAGRILDDALRAAGVRRENVYVTNAVKHFRFDERGKRRIHRRPDVAHIVACRPWLAAEIDRIDPAVVVCLGATAGRAVLDRPVTVGEERGRLLSVAGRSVVLTAHPSSIVRLRDPAERGAAMSELVADLRLAADAVVE